MEVLKASLQELVECPICYEVYHEPKALQCLHTLCSNCISQTATWNGTVKCPFCNQTTRLRDLKKDFRTQELVTIFCNFEDIGWNPLNCDQNAVSNAHPNPARRSASNDKELRFLFAITAPNQSKITQVLKYGSMYWFVLENGKIFFCDANGNVSKTIEVSEKQNIGRGILGGIVAGLVSAPLGPTVAVAMAAGAFAVGSNLFSPRHPNVDNKAQLLTCTSSGTLVALCECRMVSGVVQRLLVINKECIIKSQIGDLHCRDNIKQMYSVGDVIHAVDTCSGNIKTWQKDNDGRRWICENMTKFKHQHEVQVWRDEGNFYTMDAESVYKYNRKREIVGAHNIPTPVKGKLTFCGAAKSQVLFIDKTRKALHLLNTMFNDWSPLSVPDPEWKPFYASMDMNSTIHVLCNKGRMPHYRLYTHQL